MAETLVIEVMVNVNVKETQDEKYQQIGKIINKMYGGGLNLKLF